MTLVIERQVPTAHWTPELREELARNDRCGRVGWRLVSQTDRVRVWQIHLAPGERLPFHRHVLDYFWTVLTPARRCSHYGDGRIQEVRYVAGETQHIHFAAGREHDPRSGKHRYDTDLLWTTVEFLDSPNPPLDPS